MSRAISDDSSSLSVEVDASAIANKGAVSSSSSLKMIFTECGHLESWYSFYDSQFRSYIEPPPSPFHNSLIDEVIFSDILAFI